IEADRFAPPQILQAMKLSWQWVALPIDEEEMILWDTLTDESVTLELPQDPPARPDLFLQEILDVLRSLEQESALVARLGHLLTAWEEAPRTLRLPWIKEHQAELVTLLGTLPRGRTWSPAPSLPPARPIQEGQEEIRLLLRLHSSEHIFRRQLDSWVEEIPRFRKAMARVLRETLPRMESPPAPPAAHPSGDAEALIGTMELVRGTTIESLRAPLQNELARQQTELNNRLDASRKDWERERNIVHYGSDTLISSLKRTIADIEQRLLPEAEQVLKESQMKLREASERVRAREAELADKRKQLLLANSGTSKSPRASDDRKRELTGNIDRLNSSLPEMKHNVTTWEEVVASHRTTLERTQRQLSRHQQEYQEHTRQLDEQLSKVDEGYSAAQEEVKAQFAPIIESIQADLKFFDILVDRVSESLNAFRVDLIMDDESIRPYTEVVQQSQQIVENKLAAVTKWADTIFSLIEKRREALDKIVDTMDKVALDNEFRLRSPQLMLLPVWYVETRAGRAVLWPWQKQAPKQDVLLIAPLIESHLGRRVALPGSKARFFLPNVVLQKRLDALMEGKRRAEIEEAAKQLGSTILFDPKILTDVSHNSQMPRAMVAMLQPFQIVLGQSSAGKQVTTIAKGAQVGSALLSGSGGESDEFVLVADPKDEVLVDAWQENGTVPVEDGEGWIEPAGKPEQSEPRIEEERGQGG
ncbi:MAG: hypothetical protein H0T73_06115, partial [Ardenticatenales bacterium]|nr:hypothetical protein [Ardenticatenales bacterium]